MNESADNRKPDLGSRARDHMANERTFLAWIRTSLGIMAFGFVVERFALFLKQIAILLEKKHSPLLLYPSSSLQGYSSLFGVFLIALGVVICLFAFINFKRVEKQIEGERYKPHMMLNTLLAFSVLFIGVFLIFYLNSSV